MWTHNLDSSSDSDYTYESYSPDDAEQPALKPFAEAEQVRFERAKQHIDLLRANLPSPRDGQQQQHFPREEEQPEKKQKTEQHVASLRAEEKQPTTKQNVDRKKDKPKKRSKPKKDKKPKNEGSRTPIRRPIGGRSSGSCEQPQY